MEDKNQVAKRKEVLKHIMDSQRNNPDYLSKYFPKATKVGEADLVGRDEMIVFNRVDIYPAGLSGHAEDIHRHYSNLVGDAGGLNAVVCRDITRLFGFPLRRPYGLKDGLTLNGFPVEELLAYGLIKKQDCAVKKSK